MEVDERPRDGGRVPMHHRHDGALLAQTDRILELEATRHVERRRAEEAVARGQGALDDPPAGTPQERGRADLSGGGVGEGASSATEQARSSVTGPPSRSVTGPSATAGSSP